MGKKELFFFQQDAFVYLFKTEFVEEFCDADFAGIHLHLNQGNRLTRQLTQGLAHQV